MRSLVPTPSGRLLVAVGRDTRLSGDLLESALSAGILSEGADVHLLGIIPTPGVAYVARQGEFAAGAMISASHNPVEDNGIKFFTHAGFKLADEDEAELEAAMDAPNPDPPVREAVGRFVGGTSGRQIYLDLLRSVTGQPLAHPVIADAAHGSAAALLPDALASASRELTVIHGAVDGSRINVRCGSTHLQDLKDAVRQRGEGAVGVAFDGDADRMLAVDEDGETVDGDHLMGILAPWFLKKGWLRTPRVALTVLSNIGLRESLQKEGLSVRETSVGDRYLVEAMRAEGLSLGAEPSGHLVALPFNTTGDGILTALLLLAHLEETGLALKDAKRTFTPYPLLQENVRVEKKASVIGHPLLQECVGRWEVEMAGRGRLLVRPSGTEPLVRIMVEAPDLAFCHEVLDDVMKCVEAVSRGGMDG